MQTEHLAIASVPVQQWDGKLYEYDQALKVGTIFPELNKPFFAAESLPGEEVPISGKIPGKPANPLFGADEGKTSEQKERETLVSRISAISFALDDIVLFIDTHPNHAEAAALRTQLIEERKQLLKDFDEKFYPLTKDCEGLWGEGPMPWEGACI
ncbi:MAG: spore coat protein CotJB [Eubacteriales bacterium]|nr:spore coat protein CotJB [Eubacteriales bacterium]